MTQPLPYSEESEQAKGHLVQLEVFGSIKHIQGRRRIGKNNRQFFVDDFLDISNAIWFFLQKFLQTWHIIKLGPSDKDNQKQADPLNTTNSPRMKIQVCRNTVDIPILVKFSREKGKTFLYFRLFSGFLINFFIYARYLSKHWWP